MNARTIVMCLLVLCCAGSTCVGKELDRRCLDGDCVVLLVEQGRVFAERVGQFGGRREVAKIDEAGASLVPKTEAPIRYARTDEGWIVVVSAFLPEEYDFDAPELRLRIFDPQRHQQVASDQYNFLGSLNVGKIFRTEDQLVQISTTGAHAYVVRTVVWLLREASPPAIVLDVPGLLNHIEPARQGQSGGLWIDVQTYDGVHAETKGQKPEFWSWNAGRKILVAAPGR